MTPKRKGPEIDDGLAHYTVIYLGDFLANWIFAACAFALQYA